MKPQHLTPPSATATFSGLSSWGSRMLLSLALLSPVGVQAANYQYVRSPSATVNWDATNVGSTNWNTSFPYDGVPAAGGPTGSDNLDLAAASGGLLAFNIAKDYAINNLTTSSIGQGIMMAGFPVTTTINFSVNQNISVFDNASLRLYNGGNTRILNISVGGNVSVGVGSTLTLGDTEGAIFPARALRGFQVAGTTTVSGNLVTSIANVASSTHNLGDLILNEGSSFMTASAGVDSTTVNTSTRTIGMRSLSGSGMITGSDATQAGTRTTNLSITTASTSNATYSGIIRNSSVVSTGTNVLNLAVSGTGRQTLTGVNTYTGTTTVTGGELVISGDGSINNTSSITINGGSFKHNSSVGLNRNVTLTTGTFGYSSANNYTGTLTYTAGTLAGTNWNGSLNNQTIGAGKTISPGNSPGTATTGSQTWAAGGSFNWEINNATGSAGTNWDLINFTTGLTISSTLANPFTINIISLTGNDPGNAANFNSGTNYSWLFADSAATISTYALEKFSLNLDDFTNAYAGTWSIARGDESGLGDDSQLFIIYSIPEPNTAAAALFAVGAFLLLGRRRKA